MTVDQLVTAIRQLTFQERAELMRRLGENRGLGGIRVTNRPKPPRLPDADAEDRTVKGRTL